jgi:hypothetical protein
MPTRPAPPVDEELPDFSLKGQCTVAEMVAQLEELHEERKNLVLGDLRLSEGGTTLNYAPTSRTIEGSEILNQSREIPFDEVAERSLAKFLGIDPKYLSKCPASLKAENVNYWLNKADDALASFVFNQHGVETICSENTQMVAATQLAPLVERVFPHDAQVVKLYTSSDVISMDIVLPDDHITVPGNGLGDRPDEDGNLVISVGEEMEGFTRTVPNVWDISHGGIRVNAFPNKSKAPEVTRYFHRLICTNGMTLDVPDANITLRGNTVEELLAEMEQGMTELLETMPRALQKYQDTAAMEVPGNPLAFIRQVGEEHGIPARIINQALAYAGGAGMERGNTTSYDVLNIFSRLARHSRTSSQNRLMQSAGQMVLGGRTFLNRCSTCERPYADGSHNH